MGLFGDQNAETSPGERVVLGRKYRDVVSGFTGTATSITTYLYACRRVVLSGTITTGELKEYAFDEPQVVPVPDERPVVTPPRGDRTGGDREVAERPVLPMRA